MQGEYNSYVREEMNRMLQEARLFASISNPHIIRYNHSWIEVADCPPQPEEVEESGERPVETSVELESPFIEFDGVSVKDSGTNDSVKSKKNGESYSQAAKKKMLKISLYIQMELCRETLEDYLNVRSYPLTQLERDKAFDIARQLIDAICAIHDEYKIIHRDLSLRNIFIGNDDIIKIGDFGLATKCPNIIPVMPSPFPFKPLAPHEDPDAFSLDGNSPEDLLLPPPADEFVEEDEVSAEEKELTHGLGTKTFSAPEQMADSPYDQKADIYSLGLILLVLLYPTKTLSERFEVLQQCRKSILPKEFTAQYSEIATVVSRMVSEKPSVRPTAGELQKLHLFDLKHKLMNNEWEKLNINETKCTVQLGPTGKHKTKYLKILGDSLLLYNKKTDKKAKLCYPLKECRINSSEKGRDQVQETKHSKSACDSNENAAVANCFNIVIEHPQLESLHILLINPSLAFKTSNSLT